MERDDERTTETGNGGIDRGGVTKHIRRRGSFCGDEDDQGAKRTAVAKTKTDGEGRTLREDRCVRDGKGRGSVGRQGGGFKTERNEG